jgi:hypothetical protein
MAATNWIVGFPTETYQDFADTMTFLWRMRNMNLNNIGTGMGFGMGPETIVGQNPDKFNLSAQKYLGFWITKDFKMGGAHVHTRVKSFNIFVDNLVTDEPFWYPERTNLKKYHYDLKFHNKDNLKEIEYEKFDYNIIKTNINPYADSLVNEMWPIFRMLWKTRGGYDITVKLNPDLDFTSIDVDLIIMIDLRTNYKTFIIDHDILSREHVIEKYNLKKFKLEPEHLFNQQKIEVIDNDYFIFDEESETRHPQKLYNTKIYLGKEKWKDFMITFRFMRSLSFISETRLAIADINKYSEKNKDSEYIDKVLEQVLNNV